MGAARAFAVAAVWLLSVCQGAPLSPQAEAKALEAQKAELQKALALPRPVELNPSIPILG